MRYFFLIYAIILVLVVGIFGFRGEKFTKPPLRIFPDMDEQDVLRAQQPDAFFADGQGARQPVVQTQPRGFNEDGLRELGGIPEYEFGGGTGYYYTGHVGDYYANGMPEELQLTPANADDLIRHGREVFTINCALCHGPSGNGQGITSTYGVPVAANPNAKLNALTPDTYPDGRIFEVITKGKGLMGAYGPNLPVRDRWAVIAYLHALQAAKAKQPAEPPKAQ
ncbi:MAG: cytochrome c [Akkermansiaceae bacterium]|nr:cytochrome c [Akkermansiaceae bacterium]